MKRIALFFLLACSMAFAQVDYTGYSDDDVEETSVAPANNDISALDPELKSQDTWEAAWEKRRHNVQFYMGFFPFTALFNIFLTAANGDERDPDMMAYSLSYGYELTYHTELGIMVDYTTVMDDAIVSVVPRIKFNYLNFKYFRLYSYFGLGGIFWDGGAYFMVNYAYLGMEIGGPLSFFGEFGWGQVGMLTIGAKYAF